MRRRAFLRALLLAPTPLAFLHEAFAETEVQVDVEDEPPGKLPEGVRVRARVTQLTPPSLIALKYRSGGEGLGGDVKRGELHTHGGAVPALGEWSDWASFDELASRGARGWLLTFTAGTARREHARIQGKEPPFSKASTFEVELDGGGLGVQRVTIAGPLGGTATVVARTTERGIKLYALRDIAEARLVRVGQPAPPLRQFIVVTDISGFDLGHGYGIRSTDPAVASIELAAAQRLGVNALRARPDFGEEVQTTPATRDFRRASLHGTVGFPLIRRGGRKERPAPCPFGEEVAGATADAIEKWKQTVAAAQVEEVWLLTVDDRLRVPEDAGEEAPRRQLSPLRGRLPKWAAGRGVEPAELGGRTWENVSPMNLWGMGPWPEWEKFPQLGRLAWMTGEFVNYATAQMFTPLRDACAARNARVRAGGETGAKVYSYALRGNTFLREPHSLDFSEFYRYADNAIVYEMSNREARVWGWDSYLCDVLRAVARRESLAMGVYVKPHRGAVVQRALSAASRGAKMLYWYTYGPEYKKGDSFAAHADALSATRRAADFLRTTESFLYGATWSAQPRVGVLKAETTERWTRLFDRPNQCSQTTEDAKWTYSALQHSHVLVDAVDERACETDALRPYTTLYAFGSHVTRKAALGLVRWVRAGGTLVLSAGSLRRDESSSLLRPIEEVLGLKSRSDTQFWNPLPVTPATGLPEMPKRAASVDTVSGAPLGRPLDLLVGREVLSPGPAARVTARFKDGSAAAIETDCGSGKIVLRGFLPGCEYSMGVRRPDWDMRRDFSADWRQLAAAPASSAPRPAVPEDPFLEAIALENGGKRGVLLCNWAYSHAAELGGDPILNATGSVTLTLAPGSKVSRATALVAKQPLAVKNLPDGRQTLQLPSIREAELVLFDT